MPATTPGGLPYPVPGDPIANGADDIKNLANALDTGWQSVPWASGWTGAGTGMRSNCFARIVGKVVYIQGAWAVRTGSALAVTPGTWYTIAQLPAGFGPNGTDIVGAGAASAGVAGQVGAAAVRVGYDGSIQFAPLLPAGSIATGGGAGNHVGIPSILYPIKPV